MVMDFPAPDTLGAYQISVVVPLLLAACDARVHVAPVWVIWDTLLVLVPRVEITATRLLPETGVMPMVTPIVVLAYLPVLPVALCTRAASACDPICLPTRLILPVNVRFGPSILFSMAKMPAAAVIVPS